MRKDLVSRNFSESGKGQFLVYEAEDGRIKIDVRFENETVWLTQKLMADLFQVTVPTINEHIKNIFDERELVPDATIRKFRIVQKEGQRNVNRMVDWIKKLDAFLSVNEREILTHAGRISHEMAEEAAEAEYEKFNRRRISQKDRLDGDFERTIKQVTEGKRGKKK